MSVPPNSDQKKIVELRAELSLLKEAIEVSRIGYYEWDLLRDQIEFSLRMQEDWGFAAGTTLQEVVELIHSDDRPKTLFSIQTAIQERKTYAAEYRVVRKNDGKVVWIQARGHVSYGREGNPVRFVGTSVDITEQKNTLGALKIEQSKLDAIFLQSPAALALWRGPEMIFEKVNPGYQALFPGVDLLGRPFLEALPEFVGQGFSDIYLRVFETGEPHHGKEELARHRIVEGGPIEDRYYDYTYTCVVDADGKPYGVYDHAVDVTERVMSRKKIEESGKRLAATVANLQNERELRERFVETLTHDLRNPMAAARLSAQLVQKRVKESPIAVNMAEKIIGNVDRADRMIRNLLDANRINAHEQLPIQREVCRLDQIVELAVSELIQMHGARFEIFNHAGAVEGFWDASGLERVLENLGGNAIKYGASEHKITFKIEKFADAAEVSVQNFGPVIAPEDLKRLFEQYQRTSSAVSGGQKGWGIGLTLVRGIAEAHGGSARVSSSEQDGTIFTVRLPYKF